MTTLMTWTLGELIAKARKDGHLDQGQLSAAVGIARNSLSNYETGRSVPPFDVMVRIAKACGVDLAVFADAIADATTNQKVGGSSPSRRTLLLRQSVEALARLRQGFRRARDPFWTSERRAILADLACQVEPDSEIPTGAGSAR